MNKKESLANELITYLKTLKENGFEVYIPDTGYATFAFFVKDNRIGYVEKTNYGFNFSSVHKANNITGTGFSVHREISEPNIQTALDCFVMVPSWASSEDYRTVEKYTSWNNYISKPVNQIIKYKPAF